MGPVCYQGCIQMHRVLVKARCFPYNCRHLCTCEQARGWATELCAGVEEDGYAANTCCYLFTVTITLTEAGLGAGPGFGLAPVGLLFQYIKLLVKTGE